MNKKKSRVKILVVFIIIIALFSVGYFYITDYIEKSLSAVDLNDNATYIIEIPAGSTTIDIAEILYNNELIKNKEVFRYYTKKNGSDSSLKAGTYILKKNMNVDEIIELLTEGGSSNNTIDVTLIEGLTIIEAAELIADQTNLNYDKLLGLFENPNKFKNDYSFLQELGIETLEGYIMPETYNVYIDSDEETIVKIILNEFENFYIESLKSYKESNELSLEEIVILASIIEKEALLDEERNIVAAVFLNRLDIGWRLESCATVQYALGEWKDRLTLEDLEIESPYNTYEVDGLPIGPINSPGKSSILAVLNPADVDYLFFLAKGDGSHYFTNNYDDFLDAKERYIN